MLYRCLFIKIKNNNSISKYSIKLLKYVSYQFIIRFFQNIACKISLKNHKYKKINDAILIDTYVLPGYYTKDRYFTGLVEGPIIPIMVGIIAIVIFFNLGRSILRLIFGKDKLPDPSAAFDDGADTDISKK